MKNWMSTSQKLEGQSDMYYWGNPVIHLGLDYCDIMQKNCTVRKVDIEMKLLESSKVNLMQGSMYIGVYKCMYVCLYYMHACLKIVVISITVNIICRYYLA